MYKLGATKDYKFCKGLAPNCETWEYVNAHLQEIPENGGDFKHLQIVHNVVHPLIFPYVQYKWVPKTAKLDSKILDEELRHHPEKHIRQVS